jgi:carboxylate-amine ligase
MLVVALRRPDRWDAVLEFAASPRSTVGVEWELMLADGATGDLVPSAPEILADLQARGASAGITGELLTNTVEVISDPHARVAGAIDDVRARLDLVHSAADPLGARLLSAGSHPFAQWYHQEVTPSTRYASLIDRTQWWGRNMMIWGVHVHVGVEDRDKVMPIIAAITARLPHLQALAASSPFWAGEETGYASNRALVFQQLPTAGLPWALSDWAAFEGYLDDMARTGVMADATEVRWDVRPAPHWGTVEMRACDGVSTVAELAALAALTQCLVEDASRRLDAGTPLPGLPPWFARENKWRAARYGLDAVAIVSPDGEQVPVRDDLARLLTELEPIAADLGCLDELGGVATIMTTGASHERQVAAARRADGELRAVVQHLFDEFETGRPTT